MAEQVAALYAGNEGFVDDLPISQVLPFRDELMEHMSGAYAPLMERLRTEKVEGDLAEKLHRAVDQPLSIMAIRSSGLQCSANIIALISVTALSTVSLITK